MHRASPAFWKAYEALPADVREIADKCFALQKVRNYWSVRVSGRHRAVATEVEDGLLWFWIGTHDEYDRMTNR